MPASPGSRPVPCIGHVSPEALEGGPIGRLLDGDLIRVVVDREELVASVDLVGHGEERWTAEEAAAVLAERSLRDDIAPDARLPADTALWARLQSASGGLWGGCVYDHEAIVDLLDACRPGTSGRADRSVATRSLLTCPPAEVYVPRCAVFRTADRSSEES